MALLGERGDLTMPLLREVDRVTSKNSQFSRTRSKGDGTRRRGSIISQGGTKLSALARAESKEAASRTVERSQHVSAAPEQGETLLGTALKVITSGLGSGILAAPWGAAGASLLVSTLITAVVMVFNIWTTMIIVHAIDRWGGSKVWDMDQRRFIGTPRRPGYRIDDLGQLLRQAPWPLPVLATAWDFTVNVSNFGALVGYMIVTGDALTPLMQEGAPGLANRNLLIMAGSLFCLPLCWADLTFLTYSSAVGVAANVFLFAVLFNALTSSGQSDGVCTFGMSSGSLTCASNMIFSVIVQMCIPEYYTQLRRDDQTPDKFFKWVLMPSFGFIFVLMCSFAAVGYLAFGPSVQSNVLKDLQPGFMAKCTQFAMVIACLMVYPNMLRPMVQPLLRGKEWLVTLCRDEEPMTPIMSPLVKQRRQSEVGGDFSPSDALECGVNVELAPDIYEGRLVHTELCGPVRVDKDTGEATLEVVNTTGFVKDDLVFVDGPAREYAVVKEVSTLPSADSSGTVEKHGCIRLRSLQSEHALSQKYPPPCALSNILLPEGTKVVLDQDPALLTAAVAGQQCIQVSFFVGIMRGAGIVIGEGARQERHRIAGTKVFRPAKASAEAHLRTHDLVLFLEKSLQHNHGAHTKVVLDHGGMEQMTSLIVALSMTTAFFVSDLGLVNSLNGAIGVSVIMGIVPGLSAYYLNVYWQPSEAAKAKDMPASLRFRWFSLLYCVLSVLVGCCAVMFTDNKSHELSADCPWLA